MKLLTSSQMRALERRADAAGNSYGTMMERAGKAVAHAIAARRDVQDQNVLVLVGPGNNGGDGLVCARYLYDAGARVLLYVWKREFRDDDENLQLCFARNIPLVRAEEDAQFYELQKQIRVCDIIVDALLGTGVARPIQGLLKELLIAIKQSPRFRVAASALTPLLPHAPAPALPYVVAIDLPSGLSPDTGAIDPAALAAGLTVTFAFPKLGQILFPGADAVGELVVADIGIRQEWASDVTIEVASVAEIAARLPARPNDSHKGMFGKAMVCAGSINYSGAAYLSAMSAARTGAGLVTLALGRTIHPIVAASAHETTFVPLPDANGILTPTAARVLLKNLSGYDALLLGPGLGRDARTVEFVSDVIASPKRAKQSPHRKTETPALQGTQGGASAGVTLPPLVIDADALYALAQTQDWWKNIAPNTAILTPHPGEMATLCGLTRDEVQANRIEIAKKFSTDWNQVVVLKGAHSVIAAPDGRVTLIRFATPALATAGTGDVLAGTIVAMLAQGLEIFDAAIVGAYVHGLAGKIAEADLGRAGVIAGDIMARLPAAMQRCRGA